MAANFLNTNRNATRYFFATTENGEQDLSLQFGTSGGVPNLSTMSVALSGGGGSVIVNQAPQFVATNFVDGEQALIAGTDSTYFTMSTLTSTLTGVNISTDRIPGSGTACIESYSGNGGNRGFEFLSRGLNAQLVSTNSVGINTYLSTIGAPGATARLGGTGAMITAEQIGATITSVDLQTTAGGRGCFYISDLSGAGGVSTLARWAIGTSLVPSGGNTGSDLTVFAYNDNGQYINTPMTIRRSDGATHIQNLSSVLTQVSSGSYAQVFPMNVNNVEFGAENDVAVIAGASNQATPYVVLFSTPMTNCNPNGKTFLNMNWVNMLSTQSASVNYKVGFSTSTAYTNTIQSSYIPAIGGTWTGGNLPGLSTPVSFTNFCGCLDPDGVNNDGTATLYIAGQFSDPHAAADRLYIAKNTFSEATRDALSWRPM